MYRFRWNKRTGSQYVIFLGLIVAAAFFAGCAATAPKRVPPSEKRTEEQTKAEDLFMEGKLAEAKEDWGTAIAAYTEALQYDPESDEIAFSLSKAFLQNGKVRSSLLYARMAVAFNPAEADYWRLVQLLEQQEGRFDKAADALEMYMKLKQERDFMDIVRLAQYQFALEKTGEAKKILISIIRDPHTTSAEMYEVADLMEFNGLIEEAKSVYTTIIERDPVEVKAWLALSELYRNEGEYETAFETYMNALEKNPGNILVFISIGNHCLMKNDWECAVSYFEKAYSEGSQKIEDAGVDSTEVMRTLCSVYYYAKRDDDARAMFEKLKAEGKDDAHLYFSLGKAMNYLERYDEAVAFFRAGFQKDLGEIPEEGMYKAYMGRAKALIELDRGDEALALARDEAKEHLKDINVLKELQASVCMEMKRYEDVIAIYEWLLASDPDNRGYLLGISIVYDLTDRFKNAEKVLLKVLEQSPEDPLALNNLAYMYLENNVNPSKALKMVQQALIVEPNNGAYLDTLGWAYYKLGKYKDAQKHIERALKWAGKEDKGVIFEHYGDILAKQKKVNDALDAYRKAIEFGEDEGKIMPKIQSISQ